MGIRPGVVVEVAVDGDRVIAEKFNTWSLRSVDLTPAFVDIGAMMLEYEKAVFDSEGVASGDAWAPLAESTLIRKANAGYPSDIEKATEEMFTSLTEPQDSNQIMEYGPDFLRFGTEVEHARHQQYGTPGKPGEMPARPILRFDTLTAEVFCTALYEYITKGEISVGLGI